MPPERACCIVNAMADREEQTFAFSLRIGGEVFCIEGVLPAGEEGREAMMPVLFGVADAITEAAERSLPEGRKVSCGPACGACCRQLVPVSLTEAAWLRRVVMPSLSEDHLQRVAERVRRAREVLAADGLLLELSALPGETDRERRQGVGLKYFVKSVACPFLEDESCSIHRLRPLACREYLVTSPAAACARPAPGAVEPVPISRAPSHALIGADAAASGTPGWRTMIDVLVDEELPDSRPLGQAEDFLRGFLDRL